MGNARTVLIRNFCNRKEPIGFTAKQQMNRSLPQLGEDYNVWDESEGRSTTAIVV